MADLDGKIIMGQNIKRLLKENNMTAVKLAGVVGVSTATISDWSNGKTYPRIEKLELMANFFGVTKSDLVENQVRTETSESAEEPTLMAAHWGIDLSGLPSDERQRVIDRAKSYIEGLITDYEDHHA
ncbi:helix-turn-helix transcriptional regulator [Weissella diestrammenae]|uniref:Helix-turn-helix transcriptional regulator n=1 Tax=Weissella diestrammenae TaxID=1162633 RepID=A0A7G9T6A2_9LACO|nr:helix-turn-helix transcriptional regulator [Weissella diestrammenae]MCM0583327.1 helix-turn-helix transcriptional regulator [Weissella diestrammenae]QNN75627.1 helix-turn-helix transcriptional regulator [Weissella diestrammenae]